MQVEIIDDDDTDDTDDTGLFFVIDREREICDLLLFIFIYIY